MGQRWPGTTGLAAGSLVGAVVLALPGLLLADGVLGEPRILGMMVLVVLLSTVVPYALELHARRAIRVNTFGILMSLEPAAAAVFATLVLGEWLNLRQWLAMGCVIVASVGAIRASANLTA